MATATYFDRSPMPKMSSSSGKMAIFGTGYSAAKIGVDELARPAEHAEQEPRREAGDRAHRVTRQRRA